MQLSFPDDMKRRVEEKFNDLGDMCERGELEPEEAYKLLKVFEDEIVMRYVQKMEVDRPPQFDETAGWDKKKEVDDPPSEGPILRWQTRAVFAPGGDAWHPKNRKVICYSERTWAFKASIPSAQRIGQKAVQSRERRAYNY
ncbi:hypothetical protein GBA52_005503 [Prunus armeniaca]|nr:hypothetical protein GBA52_005503 [Prunus armeniaca]